MRKTGTKGKAVMFGTKSEGKLNVILTLSVCVSIEGKLKVSSHL